MINDKLIAKIKLPLLATGILLMTEACGAKKLSPKSDDSASSSGSSTAAADPHAGVPKSATEQTAGTSANVAADAAISCLKKKSQPEFMTTLVQDLFRRGPSADELKMAADPAYSPAKMVDWALAQPSMLNGVAYFVSNLLRIEQNLKPVAANNAIDAAIVADLKQEPVVFVQRNIDAPWPTLFTTRKLFCSARTAPLYKYPVDTTTSGFVDCEMEEERAGLLGLVSVLRGFSSAFYMVNNNYHRVALATYLSQGLQLAAKTDGPTGDGRPMPLDACVPELDNRITPEGLVYGTAAVPKAGAVCAGCHSVYQAPMSAAFLQFGTNGEVLDLPDIDQLNNNLLNGASKAHLKDILQYTGTSCWRANGANTPPRNYTGLPGLGRLIAESPLLGRALAIQIQQNLMNRNPDEVATASIVAAYEAGGKTLKSALSGYFKSEVYQCGRRGE